MRALIQVKDGHVAKDLNRRRAIRERCLNCSGWSFLEVTNCTFKGCDLYPYRTGKGQQDAKARAKSIRRYCLWCMGGQKAEVLRCTSKDCPLYPYRNWKVDKSANIVSKAENDHIGVHIRHKKENEYSGMHG